MLGSPALMLGRSLQIKATEDINVQVRRLGSVHSAERQVTVSSLVFGDFGGVQST